ncbi:GMC oxidoreductase [Fusarium sp. NRRL 25303]|nr:GMC oxidoreductase [Fusarium sp. NRRL 25303]
MLNGEFRRGSVYYHIAPSSRVRRVILNQEFAPGVELHGADGLLTVKAKKELTGIDRKNLPYAAGIKTHVDLPDDLAPPPEMADQLEKQDHARYLSGNAEANIAKIYALQMRNMAVAMRSKDFVLACYLVDAKFGASAPILNQSMNSGSTTVELKDPYNATPVVDFRSLHHPPVERSVLEEMVKWYRRYKLETSLSKLSPNEIVPGVNVVSDGDISAWIPNAIFPPDYRHGGTATVMPLDHAGSFDQKLRIYGVKSLRVIDASTGYLASHIFDCQKTRGSPWGLRAKGYIN